MSFRVVKHENCDWYSRQDQLEPSQVFTCLGSIIRLDRRVPGDATQWYVEDFCPQTGRWFSYGSVVEPGDLDEMLEEIDI